MSAIEIGVFSELARGPQELDALAGRLGLHRARRATSSTPWLRSAFCNELKSGGRGLFETLYGDPARLKGFLAAMTGLSRGSNIAIARHFPWNECHKVPRSASQ